MRQSVHHHAYLSRQLAAADSNAYRADSADQRLSAHGVIQQLRRSLWGEIPTLCLSRLASVPICGLWRPADVTARPLERGGRWRCSHGVPAAVRAQILLQFVVLGLIMQAIGPVIDSSIGMVAGGARDLLGRRPQIRTHLDKAAATVFAALAVAVVVEVLA